MTGKWIARAVPIVLAALPLSAEVFDHATWDRVLKAHVNEIGEVDYAALAADREDLDAYIERLGEASPENRAELFPGRGDELAYWLNAYNAFTIRAVVDNYPVTSVRKLGLLWGFFRKKDHRAGGRVVSLNQIEHDIIRKRFGDARIHFALVCASVSCPRLSRKAFRAETLDDHLDRLGREFVAERRNVLVDAAANRLTLSKIFDWYQQDFESAARAKAKQAVIRFLLRFASEEKRRAIEGLHHPQVKYHDYDWGLNEPGSRAGAKNPWERELAQPTS